MRLDKYLTQSSVGTRKKVHGILMEGRISVNGNRTTDATVDINTDRDHVTMDGQLVTFLGKVCYMFYKPKGCVTARSDEKFKTVLSYFTDINTEGIFMVGRLDKDTQGLLLLTNDGELDHRLMDPDSHIDKTYQFWAVGRLTSEDVRKLEQGIELEPEKEPGRYTKPARLTIIKQGMYSEYKDEISVSLHEDHVVLGMLTISEGQKHQVKRMLRAVGCRIFELKRLSIGNLKMDESLKPGEYRRLTESEVAKL